MPLFKKKKEKNVPPQETTLTDTAWRNVEWGKRTEMINHIKELKVNDPDVKYLRILVCGPVGAGKSSFINSINSIFRNRLTCGAAAADIGGHSFTEAFRTHYIRDGAKFLSFAFCDVMGLETGETGLKTEDLYRVLEGRIKDGHLFTEEARSTEKDDYSPKLNKRIHCLIIVVSGETISLLDQTLIKKMYNVRKKAANLGIPQVALMTKVCSTCPEVSKDLTKVYHSKKIKEKMEDCGRNLGIPLNCIYPVRNYHEEMELIDEVDELLLSALKHILNFANDHVVKPPSID